jgi:hypothetical protein
MLDWLESSDLRQRYQAGLNKSEQRHALAQVICTFKQGRIADRGHEAQQFRASGLNLVIVAIVYWTTVLSLVMAYRSFGSFRQASTHLDYQSLRLTTPLRRRRRVAGGAA